MTSTSKTLLLCCVALIATAGYCAWQLSSAAQDFLNEQKLGSTSQQLVLAKRQVEEFVEKSVDELTQFIQYEINQPELSERFRQNSYVAVAVSSSSAGGTWALEWFRSKNASLTADSFSSQVPQLDFSSIVGDGIRIGRLEAPDKRTYFTISFPIRFRTSEGEAVKIATGIVPVTFFQGLALSAKGTTEEVLIVESSGYAISYPDQQYTGARVDTHPLVRQAFDSNQPTFLGSTKTIGGEAAVGGFEKLTQSNLYVMVASPVASQSASMVQAVMQIILFVLAVMIVMGSFILYWGRQNQMKNNLLLGRIKVLEQRQQNPTELSHFVAEQAKKEILREFAFGVVQVLKAPLTAAVGQTQLAKTHSSSQEALSVLNRLEKEVRQSRDFIESMSQNYGLGDAEMQAVEAETVVTPVLSDLTAVFAKFEIQIEENIKTRARITVPHTDLRAAVRHVIQLMVDRLSVKAGIRKISVNVEQAGPHVFIKIADNAGRLEKKFLSQVFEPFKVSGLNFNLLRALVESAHGQVRVLEGPGPGLEVALQFTESKVELTADGSVDASVTAPLESDMAQKSVDLSQEFGLPEVPVVNASAVEVKSKLVAEAEVPVTIRKPKTRFDS